MTIQMTVSTKVGDIHSVNGKAFRVTKVKRLKKSWAVVVERA